MEDFLVVLSSLIWSPPVLTLLFCTGCYLTYTLGGVQFRWFFQSVREIFSPPKTMGQGDISAFNASMTSIAGALGTGTIVGMTTALAVGGPGSIFWMWVSGIFAMAIKYIESFLSLKYRHIDARGEMVGGPMAYMHYGLGWKKIAKFFAFIGIFATLTTGLLVQVQAICGATACLGFIQKNLTATVIALFTSLVIFGGVKWIGKTAGLLVPVMAFGYTLGCCLILAKFVMHIPEAFERIFEGAFSTQASLGGFTGAGIIAAVQMGFARSVFSNEGGLGISSIAVAASITTQPHKVALLNMAASVLTTLLLCTLTALVLIVTDAYIYVSPEGAVLEGVDMASFAFSRLFKGADTIVNISLVLFAFTTMIAWCYYGEKCSEYLFGERTIWPYRLSFIAIIFPAVLSSLNSAWALADIFNGLLMVPNLLAIVLLSSKIRQELKRTIQNEFSSR